MGSRYRNSNRMKCLPRMFRLSFSHLPWMGRAKESALCGHLAVVNKSLVHSKDAVEYFNLTNVQFDSTYNIFALLLMPI